MPVSAFVYYEFVSDDDDDPHNHLLGGLFSLSESFSFMVGYSDLKMIYS